MSLIDPSEATLSPTTDGCFPAQSSLKVQTYTACAESIEMFGGLDSATNFVPRLSKLPPS